MEKLNFLLKVSGKKAVKILSYYIDGSDRLWIRVQGKEEKFQFKPEEQDIVLGGKVIEPYLSYAINHWNVMLPYITYRMEKEKVLKYLKDIRESVSYEKEDV